MFFYELHEGDEDVFSDVLLARDDEMDPDEFFELVQSIRRRIQDVYAHDTLSEAIAVELEREHGFIYVSDDSIVASVNISLDDSENFLARTSVEMADADEDDDDDDEEGGDDGGLGDDDDDDDEGVDYRAVIVELDPGLRLN